MMTDEIFKVEFWTNFNHSLYFDYLLKREEKMNEYQITYKTYNRYGKLKLAKMIISAFDKTGALEQFNKWPKLITKIEIIK